LASADAQRRKETGASREAEGPEAVSHEFAAALCRRDAGAAASYLAAEVQMLRPDGGETTGRMGALQVLREITAPERALEIKVGRTLVSGALALCTQWWWLDVAASELRFPDASLARFVLRLSEMGWEIVIAAPWE
jgi:limonene-1,2-epoxide hydrolase